MIATKFIQFAYPWEKARQALAPEVVSAVEPKIENGRYFSSVTLLANDRSVQKLLSYPSMFSGRSVIRLVRDDFRVGIADLDHDDCFELIVAPDTDFEIRLAREPANYYELSLVCPVCGRWSWVQKEDLEILDTPKGGISVTSNGEIILSDKLACLIEETKITGVHLRAVRGRKDAVQLLADTQVALCLPNKFLKDRDICSKCGQPRTRGYENSNGVDLLRGPFDKPRLEGVAWLRISGFHNDFARTNLEFGTLATIPEDAHRSSIAKPLYRTSWPKFVVSRGFGSLLLGTCSEQVALVPCREILREDRDA